MQKLIERNPIKLALTVTIVILFVGIASSIFILLLKLNPPNSYIAAGIISAIITNALYKDIYKHFIEDMSLVKVVQTYIVLEFTVAIIILANLALILYGTVESILVTVFTLFIFLIFSLLVFRRKRNKQVLV